MKRHEETWKDRMRHEQTKGDLKRPLGEMKRHETNEETSRDMRTHQET